ncbi:MAG: lyase family protein, partial [Gemmatimonadaceae bacterium]
MAGLNPVDEEPKSHKLWGGRFSVPTAAALEALNRSIGIDFRLWPHDIRLSKAWAIALWNAGVLTLEESRSIETGLSGVAEKIGAGAQPAASDEDIHTMIDRMLHAEIGDVASKLH